VFARKYLFPQEIQGLQEKVAEIRRQGGNQGQVRSTVLRYLSQVLDAKRKAEIEAEKEQLWKDFGGTTSSTSKSLS